MAHRPVLRSLPAAEATPEQKRDAEAYERTGRGRPSSAPPPADPRYADSGRIMARFGDLVTGAALEELFDTDRALFWPATHRLTCVRPAKAVKVGDEFATDRRVWRILRMTDPMVERHVEVYGTRAPRIVNRDAGKFLALYCQEVVDG